VKYRGRRTGKRIFRVLLFFVSVLLTFTAGIVVVGVMRGVSFKQDNVAEWIGKVIKGNNVPDEIELPDYITEDLLTKKESSRPGTKLTQVNAVVIHYVGNPGTTAEQNRSYFQSLAETGSTYASSNLIVGLEGEVLLCVPLDEVAYCSNSRNDDTVSIEFCHPDETGKPTDATYDSLVRLTAWLCSLYGLDPEDGIIRHYDITGKICPKYFVEHENAWAQFKQDVSTAMEG